MTIFIDSDHAPYSPAFNLVNRRLQYRQNRRSWEYMRDLAASQFASFHESHVKRPGQLDQVNWAAADEVVFLWRDGNGLGWGPLERRVMSAAKPGTVTKVLNGRRRLFTLTPELRRSYLWRRAIEKSLLPDATLFAAFLVATPALLLVDLLRGKR
jgi:hypothetical protein